MSTPPTTAASMSPAWIMRAADANTTALEEQAVEWAVQGPASPRRSRT